MLSEKMVQLGTNRSVIRDLFEYGNKRKAEIGAENVFDFSIGNPSVPAPECVKEAAIDLLTNGDPVALHGYTSAQGDAALREKLASYVNEQHSTNLTADNFYVTVGAAESLTISLKALAEPDDEFITFAPFFPEYRVFVEMTGSKLVVVPSRKEDFQIDTKLLEDAITEHTKELSEAEEMAIFKKEFYAEIDKIPRNRTITNVAINISEEAFKNMKDDPEYREKILSALKRDLTSSFAPLEASMVLTVGATAKDYRGDSWSGVNNQSEFYARSQNSFYKKTSNKKDRQKELLEEYLEKRAQVKKQQQEMLNEKIAKQEQERSRLLRSWNNERLLSKASNAYEANAMTEAVTDSAFSLG